jgi:hypothetical protein
MWRNMAVIEPEVVGSSLRPRKRVSDVHLPRPHRLNLRSFELYSTFQGPKNLILKVYSTVFDARTRGALGARHQGPQSDLRSGQTLGWRYVPRRSDTRPRPCIVS